ncbi:GntR family transcriptional regulator [Micromonospora sonneratiae]|uniref:GntR family transcriptional regulator n=1 Tax=Micromonospora sonneratiae TaxID=1184706 RepID=A0ABW3YDI9_9ACTN
MFRVDPSAAEPLFSQLATQVRLAVARGALRAGQRLPAARELAESLQLNVHTVLHAYQVLRDEGLIELRRGRGAVVTAHANADHTALLAAIDSVVREARALNLTPQVVAALLKEAFPT